MLNRARRQAEDARRKLQQLEGSVMASAVAAARPGAWGAQPKQRAGPPSQPLSTRPQDAKQLQDLLQWGIALVTQHSELDTIVEAERAHRKELVRQLGAINEQLKSHIAAHSSKPSSPMCPASPARTPTSARSPLISTSGAAMAMSGGGAGLGGQLSWTPRGLSGAGVSMGSSASASVADLELAQLKAQEAELLAKLEAQNAVLDKLLLLDQVGWAEVVAVVLLLVLVRLLLLLLLLLLLTQQVARAKAACMTRDQHAYAMWVALYCLACCLATALHSWPDTHLCLPAACSMPLHRSAPIFLPAGRS